MREKEGWSEASCPYRPSPATGDIEHSPTQLRSAALLRVWIVLELKEKCALPLGQGRGGGI